MLVTLSPLCTDALATRRLDPLLTVDDGKPAGQDEGQDAQGPKGLQAEHAACVTSSE